MEPTIEEKAYIDKLVNNQGCLYFNFFPTAKKYSWFLRKPFFLLIFKDIIKNSIHTVKNAGNLQFGDPDFNQSVLLAIKEISNGVVHWSEVVPIVTEDIAKYRARGNAQIRAGVVDVGLTVLTAGVGKAAGKALRNSGKVTGTLNKSKIVTKSKSKALDRVGQAWEAISDTESKKWEKLGLQFHHYATGGYVGDLAASAGEIMGSALKDGLESGTQKLLGSNDDEIFDAFDTSTLDENHPYHSGQGLSTALGIATDLFTPTSIFKTIVNAPLNIASGIQNRAAADTLQRNDDRINATRMRERDEFKSLVLNDINKLTADDIEKLINAFGLNYLIRKNNVQNVSAPKRKAQQRDTVIHFEPHHILVFKEGTLEKLEQLKQSLKDGSLRREIDESNKEFIKNFMEELKSN